MTTSAKTNNENKPTIYLLTGDVGGTNSRMSLYWGRDLGCHCTETDVLVVKYFRNADYLPADVLNDPRAFQTRIVSRFLQYCWTESEAKDTLCPLEQSTIYACLAIAGVVSNNAVRLTNLGGMLVDGNMIQQDNFDPYLKRITACQIINDFVAQGYGCLTLQPHEVRHLHGPKPPQHMDTFETAFTGPKVCVGAGTGLGECYLTPYPTATTGQIKYACFPSEGGHVEFAPRNELEMKLWKYLSQKFASRHRISVERVVSGKGLANVYEFLAHECPERIIPDVHQAFLTAGDEQGKVPCMPQSRIAATALVQITTADFFSFF